MTPKAALKPDFLRQAPRYVLMPMKTRFFEKTLKSFVIDTPTRRHADTPTRRHADTPTRRI
jgi:hypothetical protein